LAYVTSSTGAIHCVDVATGKAVWAHDTDQEIWSSPLVADGKVYLTTRNGGLVILTAGRERRLLSAVRLVGAISASPAASDGTLFVAGMRALYAFGSGPEPRNRGKR
jgi:outer membrane protein assembly factor BamB